MVFICQVKPHARPVPEMAAPLGGHARPGLAGAACAVDAVVAAHENPPCVDRTDAGPFLAVDGFEGPLTW